MRRIAANRLGGLVLRAGGLLLLLLAGAPSILAQGTVWGMGDNINGNFGIGDYGYQVTPLPVAANVVAAAGSDHFSLFVREDRDLWAVGRNTFGQLGDGTTTDRAAPVRVAFEVVLAAAGKSHSMFVKTDGTLWAAGSNSSGQLGDGTTVDRSSPVQVASNVAAVAAGNLHSVFLKTDGTLWAVGDNSQGQLGDGTFTNRITPVQVAADVAVIAAGGNHSMFVKTDGTLWAMGDNAYGQLGDGTFTPRNAPVQVATTVTAIATSTIHSLFVKADGTLWATGYNGYGQLGDGTTTNRNTPVQVASAVASVAASGNHSLFIKMDGTLWAMGLNSSGQLGDGTLTSRNTPVQVATAVVSAAAGNEHSFFVKTDGTLMAMGAKYYGKLGDGTDSIVKTPVPLISDVVKIAAGRQHSLFLKSDGTLWAAGLNSSGQLGDGTTTSRNTPVQVASDVTTVDAGGEHSLFLKSNGTLWAMGYNFYGQLGDGTNATRLSPIQIATGVKAISAGRQHSLFLKSDDTLWAMGGNFNGQLGDGTAIDRNAPVMVATDVAAFAAGGYHSLFVKTDGTLMAMGSNGFGQLGDGTKVSRNSPIQVGTNVSKAAASFFHSVFVKSDGTLWAMGYNASGQLGDGTFTDRVTPVVVSADVKTADAGFAHSLFVKTDDTLWAVGSNDFGQLGGGALNSVNTPVPVASDVIATAAHNLYSLFIQTDGLGAPPQIATQPESQGLKAPGDSAEFSVTATGASPLGYQWRRNGVAIPGARDPSYYVHTVLAEDEGDTYDVVVSNAAGTVISDTVTFIPVYTSTPVGGDVAVGLQSVDESGDPVAGAPIVNLNFGNVLTSGTTHVAVGTIGTPLPDTYFLSSANGFLDVRTTTTYDGLIGVTIDYTDYVLQSPPGNLKLLQYRDGAWIDVTTGNDTVNRILAGETTKVSPFALAEPVAVFLGNLDQDFDGTPRVVTATTLPSGLEVAITYDGSATAPSNPGAYAVVGTIVNSTYSGSAGGTLNVTGLPLFTQHPGSQSVAQGGSITLTAGIASLPVATYQWYKDGVAIGGATGTTLSLNAISPPASGSYTVVATNSLGSTVSNAAQITVNYSRLVALAVRSLAGAGDNTLIAGLVLTGAENKRLIFRGVESTVRLAGVPGTINDPRLLLYSGSTLVDENDDWGGDAALAAAFPTVGLAALDPASRDAALIPEVSPGVYTAHVSGPVGDTGVALMEVYDADLGLYGSKLSALAVRSFSGPGGDVLIVGVIVDGNVPRQVVVRAVGPSLGAIVPTRMTDPELRLYSGSTLIGSNDDWGGDPNLANTFATVGLTALPNDSNPRRRRRRQRRGADGAVRCAVRCFRAGQSPEDEQALLDWHRDHRPGQRSAACHHPVRQAGPHG